MEKEYLVLWPKSALLFEHNIVLRGVSAVVPILSLEQYCFLSISQKQFIVWHPNTKCFSYSAPLSVAVFSRPGKGGIFPSA